MKSDQANSFQRVEEAAAGAFDDVFMNHLVAGAPPQQVRYRRTSSIVPRQRRAPHRHA